MLHQPKLIILDEPFSGLDPVNDDLIKEEIFNLAKEGSTIIFSTHRMEQVEEICDQIVLMNNGKNILNGTVQGVKQRFKENIFSVQSDEKNVNLASDAFTIISQQGNALQVKINEGFQSNDILKYLISRDIPVKGFNEVLPSLNDIFIKLVKDTPTARKFEKTTA